MNDQITKTYGIKKLSVKRQVFATIGAIAAAVVLPQLFHVVGMVSNMGTALGETFLPMHLPILLVGLIAGPYAGAIAGLLSPLVSFGLTSMPGSAMLPFMMIELCMYGLFAGLLRKSKMPTIAKVLLAQVGGRAVRAGAILASVYLLGNTAIHTAVIWNSIIAGIPGLILQWILLPLLVYRIECGGNYETGVHE